MISICLLSFPSDQNERYTESQDQGLINLRDNDQQKKLIYTHFLRAKMQREMERRECPDTPESVSLQKWPKQ